MHGGTDTPPFESDIPAIPIQEQADIDVGPLELDDYTGENNSHYMNDDSGDTTFESVISDTEGGRKRKRTTLKKKGKTRKTRKTKKMKRVVKKGKSRKSRKSLKRRKLFHFRPSAMQKKGGADTITEDTSPPAYNEAYEEYISLNP